MEAFPFAVAILVPIAGMIFVGAIIITPLVLRSQERQRMLLTLRKMHEDGQPLSPELIEALRPNDVLSRITNTPAGDLRRGLILIAVALGMIILGFVLDLGSHYYEPVWPLIGASAFPGLIGLASIIMWRLRIGAADRS